MANPTPQSRNRTIEGASISYNHGVLIQGNNIATGRDVNINVTTTLARTLFRSSIAAGDAFKGIVNDLSSLARALDEAKKVHLEDDSDTDCRTEFIVLVNDCHKVLQSTETLVLEHSNLSQTEQKTWAESSPNFEQVAELKDGLEGNIRRLNLFSNARNGATLAKIEKALQVLLAQALPPQQEYTPSSFRNPQHLVEHDGPDKSDTKSPHFDEPVACDFGMDPESREGSIRSMYTAQSLTPGENENWRQVRKALEGAGITPELFDQRQAFITTRIRELITGVAVEDEGKLNVSESSPSHPDHELTKEVTSLTLDSDVFSSQSSIRTFHTCIQGDEPSESSSQAKRTVQPERLRNRVDRPLKALGYDRQDRKLLAAIDDGDLSRVKNRIRAGANIIVDAKKLSRWYSRDIDNIPISRATRIGNEAIVRLLLESGADTEIEANDWGSPLSIAVKKGHSHVAQVLLAHGANIENQSGPYDATLLHFAAYLGHKDVVEIMLDHGADIEAKDKNQWTSLHYAAFNGHKDVVEVLLDHGADIEARNENQTTSLHYAAFEGHKDVVQLLLNHEADIEARDEHQATPIHHAAFEDHKDVVQLLLDQGADIEAKNKNQETSLHNAAWEGHKDVVQLLLDRGANSAAVSGAGETPLTEARRGGHKDVVEFISRHHARRTRTSTQ